VTASLFEFCVRCETAGILQTHIARAYPSFQLPLLLRAGSLLLRSNSDTNHIISAFIVICAMALSKRRAWMSVNQKNAQIRKGPGSSIIDAGSVENEEDYTYKRTALCYILQEQLVNRNFRHYLARFAVFFESGRIACALT
jgi:hypothetical protein